MPLKSFPRVVLSGGELIYSSIFTGHDAKMPLYLLCFSFHFSIVLSQSDSFACSATSKLYNVASMFGLTLVQQHHTHTRCVLTHKISGEDPRVYRGSFIHATG